MQLEHSTQHRDRWLRNGRKASRRPAFLLVLVLIVIAMASLAAVNFARSMLVAHEASQISNGRLQARMCAESGAQTVRLFLAYPKQMQLENGGTWSNQMFYAKNVMPNPLPERRGNFTIVSPALDESGVYQSIRFGLQNESAKLNLNTLAQLDKLASSGDLAGAATGDLGSGNGGGLAGGDLGSAGDTLGSELAGAATESLGGSLATNMLLALPGMTEEAADSILDWLDADDEPRPYGAEFDYYQQLQPAYSPANGPIQSIEQLLLVKGVTPQLLYGYDENRNGLLDTAEQTKMNSGIQPGMQAGQITAITPDINASPPPPLGWTAYMTLHSQEKNMARDGTPRINVNSDDLETLYQDLSEVLQNDTWASFIVAYRMAGEPAEGAGNPLTTLATMAASDTEADGAIGEQLLQASQLANRFQGGASDQEQQQIWSADALGSLDLTQGGQVQLNQILDLVDATVTIGEGDNAVVYSSPFLSLPTELANYTPVLMDYLTTSDAEAIPGRINIMECPREILLGIPGLTDDIVEEIILARSDGSESETRFFETWLAVEGYLTMEQMRGLLPLVTCGGDVYKAQVVGYLEGSAAFSRIEVVVSGAGELPEILFFRRLDHLGRGFNISTLGQRTDAAMPGMSGMGTGPPLPF
jgi:hypothetical protein